MVNKYTIFWYVITLTTSIFWVPLLIILSLANTIFLKGPPFFIQERGGYKGEVFKIVKLKTMNDNQFTSSELLSDEERVTIFGKWLRRTSLDELPSLINVLFWQMTIVGPRPLLSSYLPLYDDYQSKRHLVLPGITGWAQVNGRNNISW